MGVPSLVLAAALSAASFSDSTALLFDGTAYSAQDSFVGMNDVIVPGDHDERTLTIVNNGPQPRQVRASIVDVRADSLPDGFFDDLHGQWSGDFGSGGASWSQMSAAESTVIGVASVPSGSSVQLATGYDFPADATSGNRADTGELRASYRVLIEVSDDDSALPPSPGRASSPGRGIESGIAGVIADHPMPALAGVGLLAFAFTAWRSRRRATRTG